MKRNPPDLTESKHQHEYILQHKRYHLIISLCRFMILFLFLSLWQIASDLKWIDSFFFSSPREILLCCKELIQKGNLFRHILITLSETIFSFILVNLLSFLAALILWINPHISKCIEPYLVALNSLPKSAMAPLFLVWLGSGFKTIVVAGISVAIFGSIMSIYTAFTQTDQQKLLLMKTMKSTRMQAFAYVVIPSSIPIILDTIKINLGLSLVGVIIGEFLAAKEGLGYLIIYGSQVFQLRLVITSIIILCFISVLLYKALEIITHSYKKRRNIV